ELFAASAYLSDDPKALGSLKGQDIGKAIAMIVIVVGVITITAGWAWDIEFMKSIVSGLKEIFSPR
ncbi:MAG: DUF6754 domain-containing protein, partial [Candidatus Zixiibacteriota bacterium]